MFSLFSTVGAIVGKFKKSVQKVCRSVAQIGGYGSISTTIGDKAENRQVSDGKTGKNNFQTVNASVAQPVRAPLS